MGFRDEREALRARVERAEAELAALKTHTGDLTEPPQARAPQARASMRLVGLGLLISIGAAVCATTQPAPPLGWLLAVLGAAGLVLLTCGLLVHQLRVVSPQELLVVSGRRSIAADGTPRGYRLVRAGRTLLVPFIENEYWLVLSTQAIELDLRSVRAADGRSLAFHARALVRADATEPGVCSAVVFFVGPGGAAKMRQSATQSIESALRRVFSKEREPERFAKDPLGLRATLAESGLERDLANLGLVLETMQVGSIAPTEG